MKYWLTDRKNNVYTIKCNRVKFHPTGSILFYKLFAINPFLVINAGQWAMIEKVQKQSTSSEHSVSENVENAQDQDS